MRISPGRTHGIRATYKIGCRCGDCRHAETTYRAAYRAHERQQTATRKQQP